MEITFIRERKPTEVDLNQDISVLVGLSMLYNKRFRVEFPNNVSSHHDFAGHDAVIHDFKKNDRHNLDLSFEKYNSAQDVVDYVTETIDESF